METDNIDRSDRYIKFDDDFSLDLDELCFGDKEKEVQRLINYFTSHGMSLDDISKFMTELKVQAIAFLQANSDDEDDDDEDYY